jgi:adenine deaminase
MTEHAIAGTIVDVHSRRLYPGVISIANGRIVSIEEVDVAPSEHYIVPGLVDAHVHIESSMLVPSEFARLAVAHGTVATVSDPHEIGNVCGVEGVRYMLESASHVPFTIAFGAPSCVPATEFETAGAQITAADIRMLFEDDRIRYLSEMMNWPGVLNEDPMVMQKLAIARACGRVVDGHAPGLRGDDARRYAAHGISTDHECFTLDEALEKIGCGMKILIREGSAARNYDALHPLLGMHPHMVMFCSDDMHPDSLVVGHVNLLVQRSLELGYDLFDVLRAASVNPIEHYGLPTGLLRVGDRADLLVVDDLSAFRVIETWIGGSCVARNGMSLLPHVSQEPINRFNRQPIDIADIAGHAVGTAVRTIVAHDGQLVTSERQVTLPADDVLKLVVVNRYSQQPVAVAYISSFGLARGAIASSVAHDSHNIIAVGCTDREIVHAVNAVIEARGGISVVDERGVHVLELPVAGLMSTLDGYAVARRYTELDAIAKQLGSSLRAPFMTLSFMALLVIPQLKLSDKGLFDGERFTFTSVVAS